MAHESGMIRVLIPLFFLLGVSPTLAAECGSDKLGTTRVLTLDAATHPRVGRKHFPNPLPLARKDVVLTFDDGPMPGTTPRVLAALREQCVSATFFLLGRNAVAHPALARQIGAEGHTIAHHTSTHRLLNRLPPEAAKKEIEHGIAEVENAVFGTTQADHVTRFFRFPGFASSPALLKWLEEQRIVVFGADLWASDWNPMSPEQELALVLARLDKTGGGIVLFHDTRAQTAAMLPAFLRALKTRGYKVVHVVPDGAQPAVAGTPTPPAKPARHSRRKRG
jgi:peptidoglycan/xylan/chitin deacetylase (PgdA/CDA1 family)